MICGSWFGEYKTFSWFLTSLSIGNLLVETFNCMILLFVLLLAIVPFFYGLKKVNMLLFFSFSCLTIKMPKFNDSLAMGITPFYAHFSCLPWELTYILVSIASACRKSVFLWRMSFQDSKRDISKTKILEWDGSFLHLFLWKHHYLHSYHLTVWNIFRNSGVYFFGELVVILNN